jgi:hypothetical protein
VPLLDGVHLARQHQEDALRSVVGIRFGDAVTSQHAPDAFQMRLDARA